MKKHKRLAIVNGGMKFYTLAVVAMAALTACTNDGAGEVMNHETAEVRMTFSPYEVEPMMRAAVADGCTDQCVTRSVVVLDDVFAVYNHCSMNV